ncbi:MAG: radical SAM protein [Proteobacteria bacterium]|nr:radical SAM protein [Desulfobacula sp.]MBU4130211.1 radical SAM protein [Pseudomonadota bacterium]
MNQPALPTDACIILTYRCQMRCQMCNIWQHPTDIEKEITADELQMLPGGFEFINLTGGEPFLRDDLEDIIRVLSPKTKRIVVSTSGYHYEKILRIVPQFTNVGVRVSIEGLSQKNDELRGRTGGFDRGMKTLLGLQKLGFKDIGFGITVSNNNSGDMLWLYELSRSMGLEFATATFHNSYYFHKDDNQITNIDKVCDDFRKLAHFQMKENKPKSWFRALFNLGLIRYINQEKRMLPCEAGTTNFFIDPYGDVYPCNGLEEKYWKESMGNIRNVQNFEEIWNSPKASAVREKVATCPKNCWMVGTASPVMHKYVKKVAPWIIKNKIKSLLGKSISMSAPFIDVRQDSRQGNLRQSEK